MSEDQTQSKTISIFLVDDHRLLTDALTVIIQSERDLKVVGAADTCAAACESLSRTCPDVLLLDVALPDGDGLSLIPEFNRLCPGIHILVLTSFSDEKTLMRAIETGVNGFVSKERPLSEVITAIRRAAEGEIVMPTSLLLGVLVRMRRIRTPPAAQPRVESLTPRQQEILTCLAQGMTGAQIATALNISLLTVRTHITNLLEKLGAHSRLEAVSYALRYGLIDPPLEQQALRSSKTTQRY